MKNAATNDYSDFAQQFPADIDCHIFDEIPSTNDYLATIPFSPRVQICITDRQTSGKGQHHRQWLSDNSSSVLLSIRRVFADGVDLSGLSLTIGLALIEVLEKLGIKGLQLKWPNDVYYQDKKLAGILIENSIQNQAQSAIIGIGINVKAQINCQTPWTDLYAISKNPVNKSALSKDLINTVLQFCQIFEQQGFANFAQQWKNVDYLAGKQLEYDDKKRKFSGICLGVDDKGALLLEDKGITQKIYSSNFLQICPLLIGRQKC
ncbi:MAG: biotin--[acetyl-CoA-carboxylase] ligase [Candidatus Thioglobus sp.]|nr:MAG: biotin--[acetyl-CoA-carboxylase] ligase [Candidatus Thioglobus sp.]